MATTIAALRASQIMRKSILQESDPKGASE